MVKDELNINGTKYEIGAKAENVSYSKGTTPTNVQSALDEVFAGGLITKTLASRNIFDKDTMVGSTSQYVNSDGDVVSDTLGRKVLTIPVEGGQTYCYRLSNHTQIGNPLNASWNKEPIHQYDAEGTYIGIAEQISSNEGGWLFSVNTSAAVIKVAFYDNFTLNLSELMIERGSVVHPYEAYHADYIVGLSPNKIGTEYPEKAGIDLPYNIVFMGDSIMTESQGGWFSYLTEKYPVKSALNLAVGQCHWHHVTGTKRNLVTTNLANTDAADNVLTNQVHRLIYGYEQGNYPEPDIVFIYCGINDRNSSDTNTADDADVSTLYGSPAAMFNYTNFPTSTLLSQWSESNGVWTCNNDNLTTLVGGLRFAIETLRNKFPWVRIVLSTPMYASADVSTKHKVRHINRIIKECGSYLSIPVVDLMQMTGVTADSRYKYLIDSLHPNPRGSRVLADIVGHELLSRFGYRKLYDYHSYKVSGVVHPKSGSSLPLSSENRELYLYRNYSTHISIPYESDGTFADVEIPAGFYIVQYPVGTVLGYLDIQGDMTGLEFTLKTNS